MPTFTTISDLSKELGIRPRDLSDLFYSRHLDGDRCPLMAGRRVIPLDYVPTIRQILAERGKLPQLEAAAS